MNAIEMESACQQLVYEWKKAIDEAVMQNPHSAKHEQSEYAFAKLINMRGKPWSAKTA